MPPSNWRMVRAHLFLVLGVISTLVACVSPARIPATPMDLDPASTARAQAAAAATLGTPQSAAFQDMHGFALADGTTVVCGEMRGFDAFGTDWGFAPIYVRLDGARVLRVHIDDTTDSTASGSFPFNPATIGCTRAAEGLARG